jgi:RNA recognition motif-containing protein
VPGHRATVYVGNLPWSTTEDDLAALFAEFCSVVDVRVIQDRLTGRSRGYGFVELPSPEDVARVVRALNGRRFNGRILVVSPARPKPRRHWPR